MNKVQGDQAACPKPPIDIDVKVAFQCKDRILKRNFKSMSTGGFGQASYLVTLYLVHFSLSAGMPRGVILARSEGGLLDDVVHNLSAVHQPNLDNLILVHFTHKN